MATTVEEMEVRFKVIGDAAVEAAIQKYIRGMGEAGKSTTGFGNDLRKTNPAFISFNQVLQDAPYGIRGVGNNIQFLTQQFTQLRAGGSSTKEILKGIMQNALTPMGGLMLGVSAATSLLTIAFGNMSGKAKIAGEETKTFAENLDAAEKNMRDLTKAQQIQTFWSNEQEIFRLKERYRELTAETQRLAMSRSMLALFFVGGKDDQKKAIDEQIKAFTDFNNKISEIIHASDKKEQENSFTDKRKKEIEDYHNWLESNFPTESERNILSAGFESDIFEPSFKFVKKLREDDLKDAEEKNKEKLKLTLNQIDLVMAAGKKEMDQLKRDLDEQVDMYRVFTDSVGRTFQQVLVDDFEKILGNQNSVLEKFLGSMGSNLIAWSAEQLSRTILNSIIASTATAAQIAALSAEMSALAAASFPAAVAVNIASFGAAGAAAAASAALAGATTAAAMLPKFHSGGVVGEEVPVMAQRREMFLTMDQQASLFKMISEGKTGKGSQTIILQIGRRELRAVVREAMNDNIRLRLN